MADENNCNLLLVILDTNPVWWGRITGSQQEDEVTLTGCVESLLVFCNMHLSLKHTNSLAFIASHTQESKFLFPTKESISDSDSTPDVVVDGRYEQFAVMNDRIAASLKKMLSSTTISSGSELPPSLLSGALSMALCYIHRAEKECPVGQKLKPRILVVKASPDASMQYMLTMNCIFAAQKSNITIDACVLHEHSGYLQQAADITGGTYLKIPQTTALLQYMLCYVVYNHTVQNFFQWAFLPEPSVRDMLVLPSAVHIDYRAACFCHRTLVDIGFVCSVCLSIYCQFIPKCLTCQTRFKLPALPIPRAKKRKKENTAPPTK